MHRLSHKFAAALDVYVGQAKRIAERSSMRVNELSPNRADARTRASATAAAKSLNGRVTCSRLITSSRRSFRWPSPE
jgi:hypothetical protein